MHDPLYTAVNSSGAERSPNGTTCLQISSHAMPRRWMDGDVPVRMHHVHFLPAVSPFPSSVLHPLKCMTMWPSSSALHHSRCAHQVTPSSSALSTWCSHYCHPLVPSFTLQILCYHAWVFCSRHHVLHARSKAFSFPMETNSKTVLDAPEDICHEPFVWVLLEPPLPHLQPERGLDCTRLCW